MSLTVHVGHILGELQFRSVLSIFLLHIVCDQVKYVIPINFET